MFMKKSSQVFVMRLHEMIVHMHMTISPAYQLCLVGLSLAKQRREKLKNEMHVCVLGHKVPLQNSGNIPQ